MMFRLLYAFGVRRRVRVRVNWIVSELSSARYAPKGTLDNVSHLDTFRRV